MATSRVSILGDMIGADPDEIAQAGAQAPLPTADDMDESTLGSLDVEGGEPVDALAAAPSVGLPPRRRDSIGGFVKDYLYGGLDTGDVSGKRHRTLFDLVSDIGTQLPGLVPGGHPLDLAKRDYLVQQAGAQRAKEAAAVQALEQKQRESEMRMQGQMIQQYGHLVEITPPHELGKAVRAFFNENNLPAAKHLIAAAENVARYAQGHNIDLARMTQDPDYAAAVGEAMPVFVKSYTKTMQAIDHANKFQQAERRIGQTDRRIAQGDTRIAQGWRRIAQGDTRIEQSERGLGLREATTSANPNVIAGQRAGIVGPIGKAATVPTQAQAEDAADKRADLNITSTTRTMKEAAPKVVALADELERNLKAVTAGPGASRYAEIMTGKIGAPNGAWTTYRTNAGLLQTLIMRMHVGARGSDAMLAKFQDMLNAGTQSPENMRAAVRAIKSYADVIMHPTAKGGPAASSPPPSPGGGVDKSALAAQLAEDVKAGRITREEAVKQLRATP